MNLRHGFNTVKSSALKIPVTAKATIPLKKMKIKKKRKGKQNYSLKIQRKFCKCFIMAHYYVDSRFFTIL